ncbi:hypothetical protein EROM_100660 [Encephalitozoon romaleae SJ-2008]|uniref:Uncharacterized protein n=1 Tax=Encephalitozoon romaleae (strain SJ-2008) TaxID=1178016 RepID=I7ATS2_ENCRO|nr:hypothetical protein EROM_100660 [Encephalitozoon romaleae SJ-2008]AFN83882.1 hypothetical protein EROM_100660 [Encephalitozoon romaleae SJ-2008]
MRGFENNDRRHEGREVSDGLLEHNGGEALNGGREAMGHMASQIPYNEFETFVEDYFPEVDEERFIKATSKTIIDEEWLEDIVEHEKEYTRESIIRGLVGCLIDDGDVLGGCLEDSDEDGDVEFNAEDYLEVEEALRSFSSRNVEDLIRLYRKQVTINNKRKEVLARKLRERLAYQGYWMVMRAIDSDMEGLLTKKKGKKKKKEGGEEKMKEILERRSEFIELFKDISMLEDDYKDYEDLFDPKENVDAHEYGIIPYDYLS